METVRSLKSVLVAVACGAAVLAALSLFWLASETHYRACVESAEARYPAVPVSAFAGTRQADVGPVKLSYDRERRRAVEGCDRI